jgi:hypothetical protein
MGAADAAYTGTPAAIVWHFQAGEDGTPPRR